MAFGYWITTQLVEKAILTAEQRDSVFENLAIFQSLDEQIAFYEGFLKTSCGPSAKAIKKLVAAKNKPPKAPRAKKTKAAASEKQDDLIAKLIADANDGTDADAAAAPKKKAAPKKSKKNVAPLETTATDSIEPVASTEVEAAVVPKKKAAPKKSKKTEEPSVTAVEPVVETAVAIEPVTTEAPAPKKKAAPKKSKKTDEAATAADAAAAEATEATEALPKKKAPAAKKSKKTEAAKVEAAAVVAEVEPSTTIAGDDDEDIIQTRVVAISDKEYLIDSQNNLYTIEEPHDNIGNYDPSTGNVSFRPSYTATAAC